ncbi:transposase [Streptomyces sp. NEAU-S7GS2]|uniref:transposase n=1 Tax=Streptomyces sp. NEAU-S7GS2 TaxID=2202000 RepID=UPI000D6F6D9C|nr:transposase [Streptomyces sp. NEAU-S7GS2]AWN30118.1 hypothetical protein DKG71_31755 [Streptomyces sp. NEAU-S7GS2]
MHFAEFLKFPPGVCETVYTTNMIESLNSRFRQASRRPEVPRPRYPAPRTQPPEPDRPDPQLEGPDQRPLGYYGDRIDLDGFGLNAIE